MKNFMQKYDVSRETFDKLQTYQNLLTEWQAKFNLVSNSSLSDAWNRHFVDSVQLFKYLPEGCENLLDFGSGAGFPAAPGHPGLAGGADPGVLLRQFPISG